MKNLLSHMASTVSSRVERRLLIEYGAAFLTKATPPPVIVFDSPERVVHFQSSLDVRHATVGEHEIELQRAAMDALLDAADEIAKGGGVITARAADAGRRSYDDTVRLWSRNVTRGLEHWQQQGRLSADRAQEIMSLSPIEQIGPILDMEDNEEIYFGTFFNRSILYSVAAPGASQHLSMLACDISEFEDEKVEQILGSHGWFRTVLYDFPHFTYLGRALDELGGLGLKQEIRPYKERDYTFWTPNPLRVIDV